jgi:hypothetical protein
LRTNRAFPDFLLEDNKVADIGSIWRASGMTDHKLLPGDYVSSPNRLFYGILHDTGKFCIYYGSGPNDHSIKLYDSTFEDVIRPWYAEVEVLEPGVSPYNTCNVQLKVKGYEHQRGIPLLVYSYRLKDIDNFCVALGDDGSLGIFDSQKPDLTKRIFHTPSIDEHIEEICELTTIKYHLGSAKILQSEPANLHSVIVKNFTDVAQTHQMHGSESVTQTSTWNTATGYKIGASTTVKGKAGVPLVAEGEVSITISAEFNQTYSWGSTTSNTKVHAFNTPVLVPPHTITRASVSITMSTIAVPYTLTGIARFKSGVKGPITFNGIYVGSNSHHQDVTYVNVKQIENEIETELTTVELTNTAE